MSIKDSTKKKKNKDLCKFECVFIHLHGNWSCGGMFGRNKNFFLFFTSKYKFILLLVQSKSKKIIMNMIVCREGFPL